MSKPSFPEPPDQAHAVTTAGPADADIVVTVNGEPRRIAAGTTVATLLAQLGLADRRVAVERNREVVPRAEHARAVLTAGDCLELVTFVGGGR
jgi:sulfur carrier protein